MNKILTVIIAILLISIACLFSCGDSKKQHEKEVYFQDKYPVIDSIQCYRDRGIYMPLRIYVIDGCEYIGTVTGIQSDFLTHKGNCKNCSINNKQEDSNNYYLP